MSRESLVVLPNARWYCPILRNEMVDERLRLVVPEPGNDIPTTWRTCSVGGERIHATFAANENVYFTIKRGELIAVDVTCQGCDRLRELTENPDARIGEIDFVATE